MSRSGSVFALLILLVLAGLGSYWFYQNFSLVDEEVQTGLPPLTRLNPLLAAERFLQASGRSVTDEPSLGRLPPVDGTLIITGERYEMSPERVLTLLDWVKAGGHLIVKTPARMPNVAQPRPDLLLAPLDIQSIPANGEVTERYCEPLDVDLPDADDFMKVNLPRYSQLLTGKTLRPFERIGSPYGDHVLRFRLGKGVLTVLNSFAFMENDTLGENDNAAMLWHLVRIQPSGGIWLIHSSDMPPLLTWLWQNAWMSVSSAAVLLAAWLAARGKRFGPPQPQPGQQRRRLLDHIRASGEFFWRSGHPQTLLRGARDAFFRELRQRHPGLAHQTEAKLVEALAARSGYAAEAIHHALFHPCDHDEQQFTRAIQLLALLRKEP